MAEYAGISVPEADALPLPAFLLLRRDAWLHALSQTPGGREALRTLWRLGQTGCDLKEGFVIGRS